VENNVNIFEKINFPIFDETYRETLQQRIIDHYYFREIGVETPGRFLFHLRTKLNEIMPYYNKLYETTLMEQRIMDNYDVTETFTRTTSNDGTVNNTENRDGRQLHSDTPQGRLTLDSGEYVSDITENTDNGSSTVISNVDGSETWTRKMSGNIGVQTDAMALEAYRNTLINVDLLVINELNELFMGVY
jgi:hypothetical protein